MRNGILTSNFNIMETDNYSLRSYNWFFKEQLPDDERLERLNYHVKSGDYFPLLSTIFGFVQETLKEYENDGSPELVTMESDAIQMARKDLAYLQQNYHIIPKSQNTSEVTDSTE
jgi:hypothetical protein